MSRRFKDRYDLLLEYGLIQPKHKNDKGVIDKVWEQHFGNLRRVREAREQRQNKPPTRRLNKGPK